jgi:hypothetical protein
MELLSKLPTTQNIIRRGKWCSYWNLDTTLANICFTCFICLQFLGFVELQNLKTQKSCISKLRVLGFQEFWCNLRLEASNVYYKESNASFKTLQLGCEELESAPKVWFFLCYLFIWGKYCQHKLVSFNSSLKMCNWFNKPTLFGSMVYLIFSFDWMFQFMCSSK